MVQERALDLRARFERLRGVDWDFPTSGSQSLFSSLHWHPCRYPSQVPAVVIGTLSSPGETVLDPFFGSGTTAVEAQRLNRRCIGMEINPVATLMARAKTINRPAAQIAKLIDRIRIGVRQTTRRAPIPATVQAKKWYTERTINELRRLFYFIGGLKGDDRLVGETAFSAILLPVCRETRHWGYVCDNTAPKGNYERDVLEAFERVLDGFVEAYRERDAYWSAGQNWPSSARQIDIREGDARAALSKYPAGTAQLILTSPPYFGVTDYVKAQRLTFEWLNKPIEPLRLEEIGARSKRRRLSAAEEYLEDCEQVFRGCRRILPKGRACVVIFGESTEREAIHSDFIKTVEACGFELEYSAPRKISARRRLSPRLHMEHLLLFT
jgi:DNA modification methylase